MRIVLVAFDEVVPLFKAAARIPALGRLRWYGCDATARLPSLAQSGPSGAFAARTRFLSPIQTDEVEGSEYHSSLAAVKARVAERAGVQPSPYAYAAWDAFWVSLFALERQYPDLDTAPMKQALIEVASAYQGVVGPGMLNKVGDREFGKYVFLEVQPHGKSFRWVRRAAGHFQPMFPPYLTFD
jgi:ABC-type branched-subunit amino acid transport system substrate-binding protein